MANKHYYAIEELPESGFTQDVHRVHRFDNDVHRARYIDGRPHRVEHNRLRTARSVNRYVLMAVKLVKQGKGSWPIDVHVTI